MPVRLVWRTDVHMADRGPESRKDDWPSTVLDKLGQVRAVAEKVGAVAVLDGGDFFHVKSPSRNSHELVRMVAEHHTGYPCPVYSTPGNHDCTYGDYSFLPQQPLGVLYSTGVFKRLYDEHEVTFERDGVKVRVVGVPYHGTKYDLDRFRTIKRGDEHHLVCVAHVLASERGGTMFEGEDVVRYSDLLDTAPDVYLFGHWHKDQGVTTLGNKTFVNIGSLTRGSLSQDEVERQPACAVLSFMPEGRDIRVVRLKVKPADEVFDVERRQRADARRMEMDAFVSTLRDTLAQETESDGLVGAVTGMGDVPEQVRERALAYLERVQ